MAYEIHLENLPARRKGSSLIKMVEDNSLWNF